MTVLFFAVAHMQDIIGLLAPASLLLVLLFQLHRSSVPVGLTREAVVLTTLTAFLGLNMFLNRSLQGISLIEFVRDEGRILYMLFLFTVFLLRDPRNKLERVLYPGAFYIATLIAAISIYSYVVAPLTIGGVRFSGETRLLGALGGHNPTAGSLGMILILFLAAVGQRKISVAPFRVRSFHWIGAALIFAAILLTKSRGYLLALLSALVVMYLPRLWSSLRRLRVSWSFVVGGVLLVAGLAVSVAALSARLTADILSDPTVTIRLALFARAWSLGLQSPILGVGLGTFEQTDLVIRDVVPGLVAVKEYGTYPSEITPMTVEGGLHAHNVALQFFAEIGLLGMTLLAALFIGALMRGRRLRDVVPVSKRAGWMLIAAKLNTRVVAVLLFYVLVAGLSSGYTLVSPSTSWLLYVAMARLIRQQHYLVKRAPLELSSRQDKVPLRRRRPPGRITPDLA